MDQLRLVARMDGMLVPPLLGFLRPDDVGVLRGDGIFETLLVVHGQMRDADEHFARMQASAEMLGFAAPVAADWQAPIDAIIAAWTGPEEMALRLTVTRGPESGGDPTAFAMGFEVPAAARHGRTGVKVLTLSRAFRREDVIGAPWLLAGAKSLSYATNMAAIRWAKEQGADDAIFMTSDEKVLEGPTSTVVLVRGRKLITPPREGILDGITARRLLAAAENVGWETAVEPLTIDDLSSGDGLYLVSSTRLLAPVLMVDGQERPHNPDITAELAGILRVPSGSEPSVFADSELMTDTSAAAALVAQPAEADAELDAGTDPELDADTDDVADANSVEADSAADEEANDEETPANVEAEPDAETVVAKSESDDEAEPGDDADPADDTGPDPVEGTGEEAVEEADSDQAAESADEAASHDEAEPDAALAEHVESAMTHPRAGQPATPEDLVDVDALLAAYDSIEPDPSDPAQRVSFGTSGHRGSSLNGSFNRNHILATTQAVCDYRRSHGITGPLFLGADTHGLSGPAAATALEVLAGNGVTVLIDDQDGFTPTPAVSHAIVRANTRSKQHLADGIVITPSHNPPSDGGIKYNPPHGGPAGSDTTAWIESRANTLLEVNLAGIKRVAHQEALAAGTTARYDFLQFYVSDLHTVINMDAIKAAGLQLAADPLGGASVAYWQRIAEHYELDLTVVNPATDPQWAFMTLDWDGKIRMDCSSPYAMASLVAQKDQYQIATGNDADADRHGIVTADGGLMNPNHYLAVAIDYLFTHRPHWGENMAVGKTLVSSALIDRVAAGLHRPLIEVPVGFKWFVPGLSESTVGFAGEESAGASFLRLNGNTWTTDKDGIIAALLAAEILAETGKTPSQRYGELADRYGKSAYARIDAPATREQKERLANLSPDDVTAETLAGEPITGKLTAAPGNNAPIGGLKVTTDNAWFAARPSGTEAVYKIYAESFRGADHLAEVQSAAAELVGDVFSKE